MSTDTVYVYPRISDTEYVLFKDLVGEASWFLKSDDETQTAIMLTQVIDREFVEAFGEIISSLNKVAYFTNSTWEGIGSVYNKETYEKLRKIIADSALRKLCHAMIDYVYYMHSIGKEEDVNRCLQRIPEMMEIIQKTQPKYNGQSTPDILNELVQTFMAD